MATINYILVCRSLNVEDLEKKDNSKIFAKKKSEETIAKEESDRKYNSRKNICKTCFTAISANKNCNCE